jgi:catechol 2,3-dioxygenase-like lactoylglutathione lyase family enzyme
VNIDRLDHLVPTVSDLDATVGFYTQVLGMEELTFGAGRKALRFGESKVNLHQSRPRIRAQGSSAHARYRRPSLDRRGARRGVAAELTAAGVAVVEGLVKRTGAQGPNSVYVRDPDGNLSSCRTTQPGQRTDR